MAGDRVLISPVGMIVIHDPMTIAMGNTRDMEKAITTLNEVKESLINAYVKKSGLSRNKVAKLMSEETWLNARKAVEYGFADEILFADNKQPDNEEQDDPDEDNDNTDGDEKDGKKEKTISNYSPVWQFSSKLMEETILNQLSGEDLNEGREQDPTDPEAQEPAEEGVTETTEPTDEVMEPTETDEPIEEEEPEKIGEPIDVTCLLSAVDELLAAVDDLLTTVDVHHEIAAETSQTITDSEKPEPLTIGLDGKTEDGSMPYTLLKKQLEYLR